MIYVTGDCHQNFERFNASIFPEQNDMTKDDYVIICGDFGGVWNKDEESKEETMLMDWLDCKFFTTLFVDGNHENFDRLYEYPVEEWHGGKVHKIRPSVIHLMRGQVFDIEGASFFTFGGATSHDIDGGILEPDDPDFKKKRKKLNKGILPYRINHVSWWERELPTEEEAKSVMDEVKEESPTNKSSLILLFHPNGHNFLLTGDACSATLKDAVEDYPQNIPGCVLKVPHHGSKHNLTTEVIEMLKPSSAVISAKGSKKHPNRAVVHFLSKHCNVYSTSKSGTLIYQSEPVTRPADALRKKQ